MEVSITRRAMLTIQWNHGPIGIPTLTHNTSWVTFITSIVPTNPICPWCFTITKKHSHACHGCVGKRAMFVWIGRDLWKWKFLTLPTQQLWERSIDNAMKYYTECSTEQYLFYPGRSLPIVKYPPSFRIIWIYLGLCRQVLRASWDRLHASLHHPFAHLWHTVTSVVQPYGHKLRPYLGASRYLQNDMAQG